jgi:hypothetical protein
MRPALRTRVAILLEVNPYEPPLRNTTSSIPDRHPDRPGSHRAGIRPGRRLQRKRTRGDRDADTNAAPFGSANLDARAKSYPFAHADLDPDADANTVSNAVARKREPLDR